MRDISLIVPMCSEVMRAPFIFFEIDVFNTSSFVVKILDARSVRRKRAVIAVVIAKENDRLFGMYWLFVVQFIWIQLGKPIVNTREL